LALQAEKDANAELKTEKAALAHALAVASSRLALIMQAIA
jgi:hypothetical protein